jgi:hypothetical protein
VSRVRVATILSILAAFAAVSVAAQEPEAGVRVTVTPQEVEIGDPLELELAVTLPEGVRLEPETIGPELGPFHVTRGAWSGPRREEGAETWVWRGTLVAFETGQLELPAVNVTTVGPRDEETTWASEPRKVNVLSVLEEEDLAGEPPEISDLKPPASLPARLGPLWTALAVLLGLLGLSGLLWWLQRRYRDRFAKVPVADDPFHRTPPHVWIYAELQRLLEQRLAEQGQVDRFYAELARLLKRYLGGRFRVELMEHTTAEVPRMLEQAGATRETIRRVGELLLESDGVKFARALPDPSAWRNAVERVYRIVDTTKPREAEQAPAEEGAA